MSIQSLMMVNQDKHVGTDQEIVIKHGSMRRAFNIARFILLAFFALMVVCGFVVPDLRGVVDAVFDEYLNINQNWDWVGFAVFWGSILGFLGGGGALLNLFEVNKLTQFQDEARRATQGALDTESQLDKATAELATERAQSVDELLSDSIIAINNRPAEILALRLPKIARIYRPIAEGKAAAALDAYLEAIAAVERDPE